MNKRAQRRQLREHQIRSAFVSLPQILGRPVSLQDVARAVGLSPQCVHRYASDLIAAGVLRHEPRQVRAWCVVETAARP